MFRACTFPLGNKAASLGRSLLLLCSFGLALGLASIRPAQAQLTASILHNFGVADGDEPYAGLIQGSDGNYYGTTEYGGGAGYGTVFKLTPSGTLTTIHTFNYSDGSWPQGELAQGSDGTLYGTTDGGGPSGAGNVFKMQTDGSGFSNIHSFSYSDGAYPFGDVIVGSDGNVYGTTYEYGPSSYGTLFQVSPDGSVFNIVHGFGYSDGGYLAGHITQGRDGMLYGSTIAGGSNGWGVVYQASTDGSVFNVIRNFSYGDGGEAYGGVVQGAGSDNNLYGTTYTGGANGYGNVYKISTDGSVFADIHDFSYSDGGYPNANVNLGSDGKLYGTTLYGGSVGYGTVFQLSTDGTIFNSLHSFAGNPDGAYPLAAVLMGSDGLLHGASYYSSYTNPNNPFAGILFTVDTSGNYNSVFDLANGFHDGSNPAFGSLVLGKDGNYYGTTYSGGAGGYGTLFKMTPSGNVTVLVAFNFYDGAGPYNAITFDKSGNIYGTTSYGGIYGSGNVWKYSPTTNTVTDLFDLGGAAGFFLTSNVVVSGTKLFGTAVYGGSHDYGALFEMTLGTLTTLTILHSFNYSDGAFPFGQLILGSDKALYACCNGGGAYGYGTIFKATTKGVVTTLHSLDGSTEGAYPNSGVIEGKDGMLYAGTYLGGANGVGTAYQVSRDGSVFNVLHTFDYSDGSGAVGEFLWGSDNMLYGTTYSGGANGNGTAFQLSPDGSVFNSLYSFGASSSDGSTPFAGVTEGPDGNMYGVTDAGGTFSAGTAYMLPTQLPLIKSVSPTSGSVSAGTTESIKGTNLAFAAVYVGGVSQTVLSSSATQIKFTLTAGTPTGSQTVVVVTPHGTGYSPKPITVGP
ncbi:MAG TPA: choice-of-anchor tandem repeat GloVer-containing protein [Chthonomonadaceae bacterium]|nr:choice-of-anchor tandem repeat GloVer-containing protein [Chthonomonadaceae bacterium]